MKKRRPLIIAIIIIVIIYLFLMLLLLLAEQGQADSNIHSFGDAIWYSLVTLTTVGYGDHYPVSPGGRAIGILLLFGSIVLLSAVVGAFLSIFTGQVLPMLLLGQTRKREWFVFTAENDNAHALALSLLKENPNRIIIYLHPETEKAVIRSVELNPEETNMKYRRSNSVKVWNLPVTAEELAERHVAPRKHLVCIKENSLENVDDAKAALPLGYKIVCITNVAMDQLPSNVIVYQPVDSLARNYWSRMPLKKAEDTILFIGCGRYGEKLLEKALLTNVFSTEQKISYHIFGNSSHFQMCHSHLMSAIQTDEITFHEEDWKMDISLLRKASRIIICTDDNERNLIVEQELRRYFTTKSEVHMLITEDVDTSILPVRQKNTIRFGSASDIFDASYVIRQRLSRFPWAMNEYYRKRHGDTADTWEQLSDLMEQYYYASADHLIVKVRLLLNDETITDLTSDVCEKAFNTYKNLVGKDPDHFRAIEHMRWNRFYFMYNWEYGETRDSGLRQHPLLTAYEQLTPDQTRRYELNWSVLGLIRDILKHKTF